MYLLEHGSICLLKNYYTEFDQSADEENSVIDSVTDFIRSIMVINKYPALSFAKTLK
jgi:hypothetical protein